MLGSFRNTLIAGGTFTQVNAQYTPKGSLQILQDATAPAAFHNSGERRDPPKCHPNTRLAVLEKIMKWVLGEDPTTSNYPVMWMHGPAGAGKSAIEQSIADMLFAEGRLLASYFFSRFDSSRNHPRSLIPTLAYQLATQFSEARQAILSALDVDPLLLTRSLSTQITALVVEPLQELIRSGYFDHAGSRRVVIIDGLDECEDRDGQVDILHAISECFGHHRLPLLFLIASRPEHDITLAFAAQSLSQIAFRLPLDDKYKPTDDIKLFLADTFDDIKRTHPLRSTIPSIWPSDQILCSLVVKSSGQFIYAATVAKFVQSSRHRPTDRLKIVLALRPPSRELPFAELDALYHHIFDLVEDRDLVLDILSCDLLAEHPSTLVGRCVADIEAILSLQSGDVKLALCDLYSIVQVGEAHETLWVFHASLQDFLLDAWRSGSLHIDAPVQHARLALKILENDLVFNSATFLNFASVSWHVEHAEPTPLLAQAIRNLDIIRAYSTPNAGRLVSGLVPFLNFIKDSRLQHSEEIYNLHFQRFKAYATRQLQLYYATPELTSLIAVVLILSDEEDTDVTTTLFCHNGLITESKAHGNSSLHILSSNTSSGGVISIEYANLLQLICGNPDEPSVYFDGSKYATAALFFAKHLSSTPLQKNSTTPAQRRLRSSPWKWRNTVIWQYKSQIWSDWITTGFTWAVDDSRISSLTQQSISPRRHGWISSKSEPGGYFGSSFHDFLRYFSGCLQRAGPSEELTAFITRMSFSIFAFGYPRELKQARKAARRYLKRQRLSKN